MDVLGTVAAFLAVLVVLVLVHELGHFIVAKRAGITVQEFGIGFPPRIASLTWHGTRYSVNWIPLGGFVKMLGEDGDVEEERLRRDGLSDDQVVAAMAGAFNRKPIVIRLVVLLAGVAMNFILAAALFAIALSLPAQVGVGPLTVTEIQVGSPAEESLELGDVIVTADGRRFERSRQLTEYVSQQAGERVLLGVLRDRDEIAVTVVPRELTDEQRNQGMGAIGFGYEPERMVEEAAPADGPIDAVIKGTEGAWTLAVQIPGGLAQAVGGLIGLGPDAG